MSRHTNERVLVRSADVHLHELANERGCARGIDMNDFVAFGPPLYASPRQVPRGVLARPFDENTLRRSD